MHLKLIPKLTPSSPFKQPAMWTRQRKVVAIMLAMHPLKSFLSVDEKAVNRNWRAEVRIGYQQKRMVAIFPKP